MTVSRFGLISVVASIVAATTLAAPATDPFSSSGKASSRLTYETKKNVRPAQRFPAEFQKCGISNAEYFELAEGVAYYHAHFSKLFGRKNEIHVLRVDLSVEGLRLLVHENQEEPKNLQKTTEVAESYAALAAVNGTFFNIDTNKRPWFLVKVAGKSVGGSGGQAGIGFGADGRDVYVGRFDKARFDKCDYVLCSYPILIDNGEKKVPAEKEHDGDRHPRTMVGKTPEGILYFVVCEGRSLTSDGMNSWEQAAFMAALGCDNAFNLDGGGSSTLAVRASALTKRKLGGTARPASAKAKAKLLAVKKMNGGGERAVVDQILLLDSQSQKP